MSSPSKREFIVETLVVVEARDKDAAAAVVKSRNWPTSKVRNVIVADVRGEDE